MAPADYQMESLQKMYGSKKQFIKELELQSLIALSYYPELKNTSITFMPAHKESTGKTTMTFFSFLHKEDRHYIIYINTNRASTGVLLSDASFNAQVGVIGHELAHIVSFQKKGLVQILSWGLAYTVSKNKRRKIERGTDETLIQHHLGWQLYDWSNFILHHSSANKKYMDFRETYYLLPEEILSRISSY